MSENYDSGAVENGGDETGSPGGAGGSVTVEPVEVIGMVNGTVDQVIGKDKKTLFVIHLYFCSTVDKSLNFLTLRVSSSDKKGG